ncbi:hypothetical protein J3F83DRAFT_731686 [Trichoderma novae-zelandiae]
MRASFRSTCKTSILAPAVAWTLPASSDDGLVLLGEGRRYPRKPSWAAAGLSLSLQRSPLFVVSGRVGVAPI